MRETDIEARTVERFAMERLLGYVKEAMAAKEAAETGKNAIAESSAQALIKKSQTV